MSHYWLHTPDCKVLNEKQEKNYMLSQCTVSHAGSHAGSTQFVQQALSTQQGYLRTRDRTDQQLEHDHSQAPQVACCIVHEWRRQAGDGCYELRCAVLRRAVLIQQVLCVQWTSCRTCRS